MSVAVMARPEKITLHRAPLIDPPFDDELTPQLYQPRPVETDIALPPAALAGASPQCQSAALRFLNVCLELFNGFRSPMQMRPLLKIENALELLDELSRVARLLSQARRRHPLAKVRRSHLRTFEPRPGVIEVAAVLTDGTRSWAMCLRLERINTWRCTYLRVVI